jgi:DNA-binding NarL/FixJ family response regulator
MSHSQKLILASADTGLLAHWQKVFGKRNAVVTSSFDHLLHLPSGIVGVAWIDLSLPTIPAWTDKHWIQLLQIPGLKIVAASSNPQDNDAIQALDAGCAGYCHAFSDPETLLQVKQVVEAGHVWIGSRLMQRLIHSANRVAPTAPAIASDWDLELTAREREVAVLAANGASNQMIAFDCNISERTVKAHLSSVFSKLNISDRLQLALRVHGIN